MIGAVACVSAFAVQLYRRDRQELVEEFRDERLKQVTDAARVIDGDLESLRRDLLTASDFVQDRDEAKSALGALLAFVDPYKLLAVVDEHGAMQLTVTSPRTNNLSQDPRLLSAMGDAARAA